jgi:hypothetical protein
VGSRIKIVKPNETATEVEARKLCEADGVKPDMMIAGKPAWQSYLSKVKIQKEDMAADELAPDVIAAFGECEDIHKKIEALHREGEAIFNARIRDAIKDKKARGSYGRIHRITYASHFQGRIRASGRRILQDGKLGTQTWDMHGLSPHSFGAPR